MFDRCASLRDPAAAPISAKSQRLGDVRDAIRGLTVPLGRWATADEMSGIIEFMLGTGAGFVHGSVWYADGGTDDIALGVSGRYVRMYSHARTTQWGNSLWEFEVWGSASN